MINFFLDLLNWQRKICNFNYVFISYWGNWQSLTPEFKQILLMQCPSKHLISSFWHACKQNIFVFDKNTYVLYLYFLKFNSNLSIFLIWRFNICKIFLPSFFDGYVEILRR